MFGRLSPLILVPFVLLLTVCTRTEDTPPEDTTETVTPPPPAKLDLWAGVPPLVEEPGDLAKTLEPRPGPKKPKTVGERVELPFDPKEVEGGPVVPPGTKLEVVRYGPEGTEGLVGAIRVAFNQPMVPLAAVETLSAKPIPLEIDPKPKGKPRWLGTQVLAWEPEGRMPFSTTYEVTVPAGVESTTGEKLDTAVRWKFTTPTLALESATPYSGSSHVDLEPPITLVFNQPIERTALFGALELRGGGKAVPLVQMPLTGGDPLDETAEWRRARTIKLFPKTPLTPDTSYSLTLPAGIYGEGPNKSDPIRVDFSTYPPLRISWAGCGGDTCWANHGIHLEATNQITDAKLESKVHVTPKVPDMTVSSSWRGIMIGGSFSGGTKYTVTVDAGVVDAYGQKLRAPFSKAITLGPPYPNVMARSTTGTPTVIERNGSTEIELLVSGLKKLDLEARDLKVGDYGTFLSAYAHGSDHEWPPTAPAPTWSDSLDVSKSLVRTESYKVDLAKALSSGYGAVWIKARSEKLTLHGWEQRMGYANLFEVTDLGIAAALDGTSGLILVSRLSDGEPVAGAKLELLTGGSSPTTLWSGETDAEGLAHPKFTRGAGRTMIVAKTSDDVAFLRVDQSDLRGSWYYSRSSYTDEPRAFIYTDRTPYKPGDTIHLAGILRKEVRGPSGGVAMWARNMSASYTVNDARGIEVAKGDIQIGKFGTFDVDIETDPDGGTGNYSFSMKVPSLFSSDRNFYHSIPVETYRTPEFKVAVERTESTPLVYGDTLHAFVEGEYLHGAPLIGGEVAWTLSRSDTGFTPPGDANSDFTFGKARYYGWRHWGGGPSYGQVRLDSGSATLDARGRFAIDKELLAVEPDPSATTKPKGEPKDKDEPPIASTYTINATVTDESRQAIAGTGSFVVHPSANYVGLRSERQVLREGERAELSTIVVDLEGERVSGRDVDLEVIRKETTRKAVEKNGRWVFEYDTKEIEVGTCDLTSSNAPASCEVTVGTAGAYSVRGRVKDAKGREAFSEMTIYVHGKDAVVWEDNEQRIDLVADKKEYGPGDKATVMLRSPFAEARGVVVVEREGIATELPIHLVGGSHVVEIPIEESMIPGVTLSAMLVRGREEIKGAPSDQDLGRPSAATGKLELKVKDDSKRLKVELTPHADRIEPGGKLDLRINTRTASGDATKAVVAVMVVDEGVLSLMGHQTPDPMSFFHRKRSDGVAFYALHRAVKAQAAAVVATLGFGGGDADDSGYGSGLALGGAMDEAAPMAQEEKSESRGGGGNKRRARAFKAKPARPAPPAAAAPGAAPATTELAASLDPSVAMTQPVTLREVFATTAFFDANVETDDSGFASVQIDMPENLTTFRIMAVAVDPEHDDRFGNGETSVTVRKPIMVRPSLPRFANFGDEFEATVMVDNLSDEAQNILVGTRGLNVALSGSEQKFVEIPPGESREVRFSMATQKVGRMRLQFAALSNAGRDATEITVPVHYPAVAKAFADYGMIDATTQRLLEPPADALPDFGGLTISMSSTALSGLEDAVEYLVNYPYECAEQTASRILPIFALGDIISEFPIASVADEVHRDLLAKDGIKRLLDKQNHDGGFGYWEVGESWPYLTNWVTLALLEGKEAGYKVDQTALDNALSYVENFVRYGWNTRWGRYYDWTSRAFGLWLLSGEGRGSALFDSVWAHQAELPLYARAQLMTAAHRYGRTAERDEIAEVLRDAVVESAKSAHFIEGTSEADANGLSLLMHSSVQTDAIVLDALLETDPSNALLPKVMAGIMADRDPRRGGRWGSTHANAWALLAASRYFETVEKDEPDFVAKIWVDDDFGGEHQFKGRSMDTVDQKIAMRMLLGEAQRAITLQKDGPGKLYYRMGLRYAPEDLKMGPQDQGFLVYREYEALPDAAGNLDEEAVKRTEDGSWIVKAGTDVRVNIHVVARDRASYVVIDDALPAGFEGQNPRFLTSAGSAAAAASRTVSAAPGRWWWPWWSFSHTDLRDDRMLLFSDQMPAGVYSYSYTARATTIGTFHLPPIKAEAMYEPERFGHSSSSEVRVVE